MKKIFYGLWDAERGDLVLIPDEDSYLRSMVPDLETLQIFFDISDGTMVKLTVETLDTAQPLALPKPS